MTAKQHNPVCKGKLLYSLLRQSFALRRHIYKVRFFFAVTVKALIAVIYGLRTHQHTHSAAVRRIINTVMLIKCKVSYIYTVYLDVAVFSRSAYNTFGQHRLAHFRKKRHYVYSHSPSSLIGEKAFERTKIYFFVFDIKFHYH